MLWDFLDELKVPQIRVQQNLEAKIIFLCGGEIGNIESQHPASMRDAFVRFQPTNNDLRPLTILLGEDVNLYYVTDAAYTNLLEFERDLAQICSLVLLFCESVGSFAELGAFAADDDIAPRTLVVVASNYLQEDGFIKLGPLKALRRRSDSAVFSMNKPLVNIIEDNYSKMDVNKFGKLLVDPIKSRLSEQEEHTSFRQSKPGHRIKLLTGLVQEFGALTPAELHTALSIICDDEISIAEILGYILCAKTVDWIREEDLAFNKYILPKLEIDTATFQFYGTKISRDKQRRRMQIRQHYKEGDTTRFELISDSVGGHYE
jgi:hypothetical protein